MAVVISSVIGMALGLIAGMAGGVVDAFIMRVMDAMMAVPMPILAMFLGAILGQAWAMSAWPSASRWCPATPVSPAVRC